MAEPPVGPPLVALFGATPQEMAALRRETMEESATGLRRGRLFRGRLAGTDLLLVQTGIGKALAQEAASFVMRSYPIARAVSFGFAGALDPRLEPGQIVLCSALLCHNSPEGSLALSSDRLLVRLGLAALKRCGIAGTEGTNVTVDRVAETPEEKKALFGCYGASVVDMEGYWIALAACRHAVPFLGVKAISDTAGCYLPSFQRYLSADGKWLFADGLRCLLSQPHEVVRFAKLYRGVRKAQSGLKAYLPELLACSDPISGLVL